MRMNRIAFFAPCAFAVSVALTSTGVTAQVPAPPSSEKNLSDGKAKDGAAAAVGLLRQAGELVRYARENESSVAMLAAVQMIRRVRFAEDRARLGSKKPERQETRQQGGAQAKGPTPPMTFDTASLLAEARGWARSDPQMLALLKTEMSKSSAAPGGTLGADPAPAFHIDKVLPEDIDNYQITFRGGQLARVVVIGDGDTDLDLYVFDENGNEIGKDVDNTDKCIVDWTPKWTGSFRIRIANLGKVYNQYVLVTN